MLRESNTAVIGRNEVWTGASATEPYEAAWASEAIFWLRALETTGDLGGIVARVQISPDGIRWVDEGSMMPIPNKPDDVTLVRVAHFGNWLRLAVDLPKETSIKILATITLKA